MAWIFTHGPIPSGIEVCHSCDNPPCCRIDHLFLGTPADNSADMVAKGRAFTPSGPNHYAAKLTAEQVLQIRGRYADGGITMRELSDEYGVGAMSIHGVISGKTYRNVVSPAPRKFS